MVAKRLAALIAAVALIIGAVALRRSFDGRSSASPVAPGTSDPAQTAAPQALRIVCISELAAACDAARAEGAATTIESYADTLARIEAGDIPPIWVTFERINGLAVNPATNQSYFAPPAIALASSQLLLVAPIERATAFGDLCGGASNWTCIGKNAGKSWADIGGVGAWGRLIPGHADPTRSAVGLLMLGSAAASYYGAVDMNQAQINGDLEFGLWFNRLESSIPKNVFGMSSPLDAMLTRKLVSVVGTTHADLAQRASAQLPSLTTTFTGQTAAAVAATVPDAALPDEIIKAMTDALIDATWDPVNPENLALPSSGVLRTLRDNWSNLL